MILIAWWARASLDLESKATSEEYGEHMEIDIRLPYKRFKEIYPYSKIANQEYKQLQMKNAFKRSGESREEQANGQIDNY